MPQIKLTELVLKDLVRIGDDVQTDYHDIELRGFSVRVGATAKTFRVAYRAQGKIKRESYKDAHWPDISVKDARAWARKLIGDPEEAAKAREAKKVTGPTLGEALEYHLKNMRAGENRRSKACSQRSIDTLQGGVELHFKAWLDRSLIELDADAIEEVLKNLLKNTKRRQGSNEKNQPGRATANRLLSNIGVIWRSWHRRYGLAVPNPCERLRSGALDPRDSRVINFPDWMAKVQAIENPVRRDLQLFSLFSAVRSDGLRHLRWDDVDFDEDLIHIARAKGDKPYTIVMTATLREILERREKDNATIVLAHKHCAGWVFPSPNDDEGCVGEVKQRKAIYDVDGDLERWESVLPGPHVNRRTYNMVAIEIGIPPEVRERLLNHAGKGVNVRHYGGVPHDWTFTRECAEKIEAGLWLRIRNTRPTKGKLRSVA